MDTKKKNNDQGPSLSHHGEAPPDPSNTSHIGQPIEQGVISKKDGISEQSAEWEDSQERGAPADSLFGEEAEKLLKNPSPEEKGTEGDDNV